LLKDSGRERYARRDNNGCIFDPLCDELCRSVVIAGLAMVDIEDWYFAMAFVEADNLFLGGKG